MTILFSKYQLSILIIVAKTEITSHNACGLKTLPTDSAGNWEAFVSPTKKDEDDRDVADGLGGRRKLGVLLAFHPDPVGCEIWPVDPAPVG